MARASPLAPAAPAGAQEPPRSRSPRLLLGGSPRAQPRSTATRSSRTTPRCASRARPSACSASTCRPAIQGCRSDFRPPICGSRAARALEVLIRGFVRCLPQTRYSRPQHQRGLLHQRRLALPAADRPRRPPDRGGPGARRAGGAVRVPGARAHRARQPPRRLGLPGRPGDPLRRGARLSRRARRGRPWRRRRPASWSRRRPPC